MFSTAVFWGVRPSRLVSWPDDNTGPVYKIKSSALPHSKSQNSANSAPTIMQGTGQLCESPESRNVECVIRKGPGDWSDFGHVGILDTKGIDLQLRSFRSYIPALVPYQRTQLNLQIAKTENMTRPTAANKDTSINTKEHTDDSPDLTMTLCFFFFFKHWNSTKISTNTRSREFDRCYSNI